ncbi:MAG: hypothetical protein ACXQS5_06740 [Candidatus Methanospirareceae archaeon]
MSETISYSVYVRTRGSLLMMKEYETNDLHKALEKAKELLKLSVIEAVGIAKNKNKEVKTCLRSG